MVKSLIFGLIVVLLIAVGFGAYFLGKSGVSIKVSVPTATPTPSGTLSSPTPKVGDETSLIKAAILKRLGTDESQVNVTVSKIEGDYAKGSVGGSGGGGYFIAAKKAGEWLIVYDGQANPSCAQIAPYNFPIDMVPECLNSNGGVVVR